MKEFDGKNLISAENVGNNGNNGNNGNGVASKSYEDLENDFMPLILSAVRHYRGLAEWDDLMQEARLAFYQGVMEFDTERELLIVNQPIEDLEGESSDYLDLLVEEANRQGMDGGGLGLESDADYICDRLDMDDLIREAGLSALEAQIVSRVYYGGVSQADLARSLGISRQLLRYYLQEALARLRSYLEENLQV